MADKLIDVGAVSVRFNQHDWDCITRLKVGTKIFKTTELIRQLIRDAARELAKKEKKR